MTGVVKTTKRRATAVRAPSKVLPDAKSDESKATATPSSDALRRGELLKAIIEEIGYGTPHEFARDSKIAYSNLWHYMAGQRDVAKMGQSTVELLLGALNVTDTWAWAYFEIPESARKTWRTFRPPPMGHGDENRRLLEITLDMPLQGDLVSPKGNVITVDRDNTVVGQIVTRLADRYLVTPADLIPGRGLVLGQLIRIDLATTPG